MEHRSSIQSRSGYSLLVGIGYVWGVALCLMGLLVLASGYLGSLRDLGKVLLSYWWIWIGPLSLIVGAHWGLQGKHRKASIFLIWVGCLHFTATMVYQAVGLLHDANDPLIMKPGIGILSIHLALLLLALLADVTAFRLSRKSK